MGDVTFLAQKQPVDEYGRALYAVSRSIVSALLDSLSDQDLTDLNSRPSEVTMRQLSHYVRIERDKGMRGDGFEWAVHEAIAGGEWRVTEIVAATLAKASPKVFKGASATTSLMFGYERAKYLGFLEAVVQDAGEEAVLIPDSRGRPYRFTSDWLTLAAAGAQSEQYLNERIEKVWKTDAFLSDENARRYAAATIKSNHHQLEGGPGLRIGIVPAAKDLVAGVHHDRDRGLWLAALPDPDGFMGLFNDAYWLVASAIYTIGKHNRPPYYFKPSAKALRITEQLEKFPTARVVDIIEGLNEAADQELLGVDKRLVPVAAPDWLHLRELQVPVVVAPRPMFEPV